MNCHIINCYLPWLLNKILNALFRNKQRKHLLLYLFSLLHHASLNFFPSFLSSTELVTAAATNRPPDESSDAQRPYNKTHDITLISIAFQSPDAVPDREDALRRHGWSLGRSLSATFFHLSESAGLRACLWSRRRFLSWCLQRSDTDVTSMLSLSSADDKR